MRRSFSFSSERPLCTPHQSPTLVASIHLFVSRASKHEAAHQSGERFLRDTSQRADGGSAKRKTVPPLGLSSAYSRPPCASTMTRQIERPTPRPPAFVVTNGSNSCARIAGDRPGPVSATLISTMLSAVSLVVIVSTRRSLSPIALN